MNKYNAGRDAADLRALCAILYRKPVKDKGCILREPFRMQYMSRYMGLVRDMPEWVQLGRLRLVRLFCEYLFPEFLSSTGWNSASLRYLNGAGKVRMYSREPLKVWV